MDNSAIKHLQDLYGLNPNIPHLALQFPRLPPGLTHPMFKIYEIPMKEQFSQEIATINQKLQGFQHMYQQYASGLISMNSAIIILIITIIINYYYTPHHFCIDIWLNSVCRS